MARALWDAGAPADQTSAWDTMGPGPSFLEITRRTGFERVIEGLLAAKDAGFDPVKVNAVAIKGA
jgi:cyclic pyranopterin phosphate synthase